MFKLLAQSRLKLFDMFGYFICLPKYDILLMQLKGFLKKVCFQKVQNKHIGFQDILVNMRQNIICKRRLTYKNLRCSKTCFLFEKLSFLRLKN